LQGTVARKLLQSLLPNKEIGLQPLGCNSRELSKNQPYGYELTIFQALATPKYQIFSSDKIQGGIGDNLASMIQFVGTEID
jgi:hypothetical protein